MIRNPTLSGLGAGPGRRPSGPAPVTGGSSASAGFCGPDPARCASAFLKMTSGRTSTAMTPKSQTTSVAITQVEKPLICSPSVSQVVTSSPTKVVTSAMPPVMARTYRNDSLKISGARMKRTAVKMTMTQRKPDGVMTNPGSSHLATSRPMALATSSTTVIAINRTMGHLSRANLSAGSVADKRRRRPPSPSLTGCPYAFLTRSTGFPYPISHDFSASCARIRPRAPHPPEAAER